MAVKYDDDGYKDDPEIDEFDYNRDLGTQPPSAAVAPDPQLQVWSLQSVGKLSSSSGGITVTTTEQGLPTAIHIEKAEMNRSADALARDILRLCRQAGRRAAATHRAQLLADGVPREALSHLKLPTAEQVAREEAQMDAEMGEDNQPDTWMRRV